MGTAAPGELADAGAHSRDDALELTPFEQSVADTILREACERVRFLRDVGLAAAEDVAEAARSLGFTTSNS